MPASDERKLGKVATLSFDELILDLEDSVAEGAKERARRNVGEFLSSSDRAMNVGVRINPVRSKHGRADLAALASAADPPDAVVLPKTETAADIQLARDALSGAARPVALQALIETALGLAAIDSIVAGGNDLESLILGYEDLAASLGRANVDEHPGLWLPAQHQLLIAARANGLRPVDGPSLELTDADRLALACRRANALGFDAKWAIHPAQLESIARAFGPSAAERARAQAVVAALGDAATAGSSAVALDGRMIDTATARWARRVLGHPEL